MQGCRLDAPPSTRLLMKPKFNLHTIVLPVVSELLQSCWVTLGVRLPGTFYGGLRRP
jgi:hypothetical protein